MTGHLSLRAFQSRSATWRRWTRRPPRHKKTPPRKTRLRSLPLRAPLRRTRLPHPPPLYRLPILLNFPKNFLSWTIAKLLGSADSTAR